eukprot:12892212-Heterocapsa_arctica.AAC.1
MPGRGRATGDGPGDHREASPGHLGLAGGHRGVVKGTIIHPHPQLPGAPSRSPALSTWLEAVLAI